MPNRMNAPTYSTEIARDYEFRRGSQTSKFEPLTDGKVKLLFSDDWNYKSDIAFERAFRGFAKRRGYTAHIGKGERPGQLAVQLVKKQDRPF